MTLIFPSSGIVPRDDTTSGSFVQHNPTFDGRGVIIGVLDTGIDPGAEGLQVTTTGEPKLIDIVDCSGSGDVDMSKKVTFPKEAGDADVSADDPSSLTGLTGRKLLLPTTMKNPTKTYHLGMKRAYELYPDNLTRRVKGERKKAWTKQREAQELASKKKLSDFHLANKPDDKGKYPADVAKVLTNIEDEISELKGAYDKYDDPGPLFDCVVWHDGESWQAMVDTSETGDFTSTKPMTNYRVNRDYRLVDNVSMLNYSVNIYDEGSILSINVDAGAHGSHVAGICAGYHPDREDLCGVAPGAQVISLKIGDSRLGSMETGPGLIRAMTEAKRLGCDVINMSYGEACCLANSGRFIEEANELVNKWGVIFVASAGNNGPALTTVGCPGGTTTSLISVGAYVSPSMMTVEYSMRELSTADGSNYTWSSVGPAEDGGNGVDVIAPGGAICSVPNWCLQKNQLMNGTSMSGPNCAGCVALLCSGLKQKGVEYTPHRVKKALFNSCKNMDHLSPLVQGFGMVQVDAAFDYLLNNAVHADEDVRFDVRVNRRLKPSGIYLRSKDEISKKQNFSVTVTPNFSNQDDVSLETQKKRVDFEMRLNLTVKMGNTKIGDEGHSSTPDCSFVTCPDHSFLMSNGRGFEVEVDPTNLPPGVHFARIYGHDSQSTSRGFIFSCPITIVVPHNRDSLTRYDFGQMNFGPAETKRFFLDVPLGATFMDVKVKDCRNMAGEDATTRTICIHSVQLMPHTPYRDCESKSFPSISPGETIVKTVAVEGGVTCELVVGRYWSTLGYTEMSCDVEFRGVESNFGILEVNGSNKFTLFSRLRDETVNPSASLDRWQKPLRPKEGGNIEPCGERDILSSGKQVYGLTLEYSDKVEEAGEIKVVAKGLQTFLYESAFESQFFFVYNNDKKVLGRGDCWPDKVKVEKGDITIRVLVKHDDVELLEKLKHMVIYIERSIKAISVPMYSTHEAAITNGSKFGKYSLKKGCACSVFGGVPSILKSLPKGAAGGDKLFGSVAFEDKDSSVVGKGVKPGGHEICLIVPPKSKGGEEEGKKKVQVKEEEDTRSELEKLEEECREWKSDKLEKLIGADEKSEEKFLSVYNDHLKNYPDNLRILHIGLKNLDNAANEKRKDRLSEIVERCDLIIGKIDQVEMAGWFGIKHDLEDGAVVKTNKEWKDKKEKLVDCLGRKCKALIDSDADDGVFEAAMKDLKKWEKVGDNEKFAALNLEILKRKGFDGSRLALINKLKDGEGTKGGVAALDKATLLKMKGECFKTLGWDNLNDYAEAWKPLEKPGAFAPF